MRRSILFLILGILGTALLSSAISVYIFHDVDRAHIGHWNEVFAGLCAESILFALMIVGPVWFLTLIGHYLLHLRSHSPRAMLGLLLGIGVTVIQYPWDIAGRKLFPKFADFSLTLYLILAVVFCTIVLLHDNFTQMKLCKVYKSSQSI